MVKTTKIILSILLLFALLAVSGCTGTDGNADDASSEVSEDTAMEEAATEESAVDEDETESEEAETTEEVAAETISETTTLHECNSCHEPYTMDEMRAGIHKEAFEEDNSAMHVDTCANCHNVEVACASADCHALPEVMKAQVTT